jgi:hypothetical protein
MTDSVTSVRYARRARLRAAVFGGRDHGAVTNSTVVTGVLAAVSARSIVVATADGERLLSLSPSTSAWLGAPVSYAALRPGDPVVVRSRTHGAGAVGWTPGDAERIWARIGRVTGTIAAADGREFLVDPGLPGHPPQHVVLAEASFRQVQVRFPRLAPGYLLDVIGTWHGSYLLGVTPATRQPAYHAGHPPSPSTGGHIPDPVSGTAVWHDPVGQSPDLRGLGYPALDPESEEQAAGMAPGCVRLPYLSLGCTVRIRNECTGDSAVLPVTSGAENARQFCDRCVKCGTPPRGRIADLTVAAFVELGGNLEEGCFNATLTLPG